MPTPADVVIIGAGVIGTGVIGAGVIGCSTAHRGIRMVHGHSREPQPFGNPATL